MTVFGTILGPATEERVAATRGVPRELESTTADDGTPALVARARAGSVLPDVAVHPLTRGDVRPLQRVFDGLSPRSRATRFLSGIPSLSPAMAARLADVDHDDHGCWVAAISGEPVGIGRYIRTVGEPAVAEIALEVVDACQGHGLGRLLLDVVGAAAADAGVTSLSWLMDEANRRVRRLAAPLGGRFTLEDGVLEGTTALPMLPPFDDALIARCARAARRRAAGPTGTPALPRPRKSSS